MRVKFLACALAALALLASGCDKGLAFAPKACVLVAEDAVQKATGNSHLKTNGKSVGDGLGGSVCTYRDSRNDQIVWKFSDDPASTDDVMAHWRKSYGVHPTGGYSLDAAAAENSHVLTSASDSQAVRGIMTQYPDTVISVVGPKGATFRQITALRALVLDGFNKQAAAAVSGQ